MAKIWNKEREMESMEEREGGEKAGERSPQIAPFPVPHLKDKLPGKFM